MPVHIPVDRPEIQPMPPSSPGSWPPARRRWGQNFLASPAVARRLVDLFLGDVAGERRALPVVEIGPGRGALTRELASRVRRLVALEIDPLLHEELLRELGASPALEVRLGDALETDFEALAEELGGAFRVIGNLPYNVGTAVVRRLLRVSAVADFQVVLQQEVVDRFLARPGTKAYGPLAVISQLRGRPRRLLALPPSLFRPRPKVHSAVLSLVVDPRAPLAAGDVENLERWLFRGFGHRRKTLAGNLGPWKEAVREFLVGRGLPADARAEAVPAEDWLALGRRLDAIAGASR
ncbi:MAG: 16S rRNA (adenine(1518)-N(6)/adenine(1519)-N(6))-dimethyltransferase RsmA [Acidobacteriota bacterium]|nr:16S rRNA (adenine(1518)-N(6)/adenine(1519)-N(6))-dimethyltransferase RsmA [Acidobacteriota bacterium]MDQ7087932.1 16S rRNA (adenine(1518)-N(6)/adenine(1519)-N(6))-dimethyltransferase RsmA [Acidobacteriota bacterium]